jgi:FAD/FMN-containing dehydrogenase
MNVHARWQEADQDEACVGWARGLFAEAEPHALGTAYVNFMTEEESGRVESAYGANFERLQEIKQRYDPDNFFRRNQNVKAKD